MPTASLPWLLPDGRAGGPIPDGSVRVAGAVVGDTVRYEEESRKGRTVFGQLVSVLTPSPTRRPPSCPHHAACGGCDLAEMQPDARLEALTAMVRRSFRFDRPPPIEHDGDLGTRARITMAVTDHAVGYHPPRSHEVLDIAVCEIARPEVQAALTRFRSWRATHRDQPVTQVVLRSDGTRVVTDLIAGGPLSEQARASLAELGAVTLDGKPLHGDPVLRLDVLGTPRLAGHGVFFQVHLRLNARLVTFVRDAVLAAEPERVLDLYAGNGNLGLAIAEAGVPVLAVELPGRAMSALKAHAAALGLETLTTLPLDARRLDPSRTAFDVAVLDPPRAGAGPVMGRVLRNRPRRVVLVSCDPRSGGRDVSLARKQGYEVVDARAFDLFPRTHHVEVVTVLDRR